MSLPVPLDLSLRAAPQGVAPMAKLEYEGVFAALASVFPIGVFRTDPTGLLTHVDEALQTHLSACGPKRLPTWAGCGWCTRTTSSACSGTGSRISRAATA